MLPLVNRESPDVARGRHAHCGLGFRSAFRRQSRPLASAIGAGVLHVPAMRLTALREQLSQFEPADATEARFLARMSELTHEETAWARSHFVPGHFTASAFVLSPDRSELVLIHHKKLGIWVQPGGHVDATDRDLESAARREVAEEVGLRDLDPLTESGTLFDVDIHAIPARKDEPAHEHFDVRFAFVSRTRDLECSDEVADVRWVPLDQAHTITTDRSVLRAVEKLRARPV
jgi:8-oxo-dGTP pyrophosphatase MutT (NUDIX family)